MVHQLCKSLKGMVQRHNTDLVHVRPKFHTQHCQKDKNAKAKTDILNSLRAENLCVKKEP